MQVELINYLKEDQILRLYCSDLGAICGYNPFCDYEELFEKYLYQDLQELLQLDAKNLGQEIITVEEEVEKILQKIDIQEVKQKFHAIKRNAADVNFLNNNATANEMLEQIRSLVKDEKVKSKVSSIELQQIEKEYAGKVRKNYGSNCESSNLDLYEEYSGFKVVERNLKCITMKVMPLDGTALKEKTVCENDEADSLKLEDQVTTGKSSPATENSTCSDSLEKSNESADAVPGIVSPKVSNAFTKMMTAAKQKSQTANQTPSESCRSNAGEKRKRSMKRKNDQRPSFLIVGRVDGVSYQIDTRDDDAQKWFPIKVVVEMKTRVRAIRNPPPIYEQIQLVAYMLILQCQCGDLVQSIAIQKVRPGRQLEHQDKVVDLTIDSECEGDDVEYSRCAQVKFTDTADIKEQSPTSIDSEAAQLNVHSDSAEKTRWIGQPLSAKNKSTSAAHVDASREMTKDNFHVTRIYLKGEPYYHKHHWDTVVMPRLRCFREAVITMRKDDSLRYQYLVADETKKQLIISSLCPYLDFNEPNRGDVS